MPRARVLLTAAAFLALLSVAPTAAAQEDSPTDGIVIEATDDSVATIEDGEIVIRGSVVPHAKSSVDEAFRIRSTGDDEQRVWVESGVEGVEFHRSDDGTPVERVTLDPGESVGVGLTVDSSADLEGDTFTIRIETDDRESAFIEVTDVDVDPREVAAGDTATITATVENAGDASGRQPVRLEIDGVVVAQRDVHLRAGETRAVSFERRFQRVGTFYVDVSTIRGVTIYTTRGGTVTVGEPADGAVFEVTEAGVSSADVEPGENVDVTATVENVGNREGRFSVELAVAGIVFQSQSVTIGPGERTTVTFTREFDQVGTFPVSVSGADAGTVTVGAPAGPLQQTAERVLSNPGTSTVGLAALAGLLAISRSSVWKLLRRYR